MALDYDYSLDREAVVELLKCLPRERRLLVDAFATLARHPTTRGDYSFVSADGRENQVVDLGAFVVTYWTDHAARNVRILVLERA